MLIVNYMINKNIKPKLSKDIVYKKEGKNQEILSLASCKGGPIRILNEVASKIIVLSNGNNSINNIIEQIYNSFEDTNEKSVENDVLRFLKILEKENIIETLN